MRATRLATGMALARDGNEAARAQTVVPRSGSGARQRFRRHGRTGRRVPIDAASPAASRSDAAMPRAECRCPGRERQAHLASAGMTIPAALPALPERCASG